MQKHFTALFLSIFLLVVLSYNSYGQSSFINYNSAFRYYAAQEEPATNWYQPEFNDQDWSMDTNSIGFGNESQRVTISPETKSLYLRYHFNVNTPGNVKEISFSADYDDGYIAYLNGKEILRVNIDEANKFPAYDALTYRSHETEYRKPFPVYAYYLDSLLLDSCLVEGENVVAVHVLNDSLDGSDLYFKLDLYNVTTAFYSPYMPAFRYSRKTKVDSVNFPLVLIETDEFGITYKNQRVKAQMGIIDNGSGAFNKPSDPCNVYTGSVSIEVRGQSSSEFPKRSYRFELWDEFEQDTNVSLLGMPANDDWILFAPFQDKAHFRNTMIFDLARRFGRYQPRTRYCELILNDEYKGLYLLVEKIKRSPDRLNLARLRPDEIDGNDVTGGFIIKYDKPGGSLQIVYPNEEDIVQEQIDYIMGFLESYETALFTNDFMDPVKGFRKYINDTSLIDYIIMTEFPRNCDGYMNSTYFYKDRADRDNRLTYGPMWDNDLVFGNTTFQRGDQTDGWHFEFDWGRTNIHILRMLQDRDFVELFQERWGMARASFLHTDSLMAYIDSAVNYLADPIERNYEAWPVIGDDLFSSNYISTSYENEIYNIKNWLNGRLEWLDDNIGDIYYDVDIYSSYEPAYTDSYFGFEIFPIPFTDVITIACSSSEDVDVRSEIFDLSGQLIYAEENQVQTGVSHITLNNSNIGNLTSGIYFLRILKNGELVSTRKINKQ